MTENIQEKTEIDNKNNNTQQERKNIKDEITVDDIVNKNTKTHELIKEIQDNLTLSTASLNKQNILKNAEDLKEEFKPEEKYFENEEIFINETCSNFTEYYLHQLSISKHAFQQIILCKKLIYKDISDYIPYIVDIMIDTKSDAIYNLLLYRGKNMQIRVILFCYLKSILSNLEDVNKAAMCYYLCCDLYEIEIYQKRKNTKILEIRSICKLYAKKKHSLTLVRFRTQMFTVNYNKLPNFNALFMSLMRNLVFFDGFLFDKINEIQLIYNKKRNLRNITSKSKLSFKRNLRYYYDLIKISDKLSELPKNMKQRLLIVNLELFNINNGGNYINLISKNNSTLSKHIEKLHVTSSLALDSKANGPFMVNSILQHKHKINSSVFMHFKKKDFKNKSEDKMLFDKANTLAFQFDTIKDIDDINDITGIRSNILIAIEQILLEKIIQQENTQVKITTNKAIKNDTNRCNPHNHFHNKSSFIVKNGSIMKEEYLAIRIITQIKNIFIKNGIPIFLRNYKIIIIAEDSGIVETVENSISIHKIKEKYGTIKNYFDILIKNKLIRENIKQEQKDDKKENDDEKKGGFYAEEFKKIKNNFLQSLVGYSLIQYLLSLKDRHNANILIDEHGHMIHIDFGYILGKYPGFYGVESAPFKFSMEYLDIIDINDFKKLFFEGFMCLFLNKHILPVEIADKLNLYIKESNVENPDKETKMKAISESIEVHCESLINKSVGNYLTVLYDQFQYLQNGYYR
ncbi:pi4kb [Ecytonucleospora hepatopenaei]|uniref:Pi4kb n=1 Tax=Ecytonucleospora hepatopenaei TaxID=646526 RepID=A0A1W0E8Z8_9MICR|nr:pi4kb [Ecytonucleospora hepatopenaei]